MKSNNYLTFNAADRLTRVDKPSNAYDTFTYDYNGNLTQMDRYYPTPLLATENRKSLLMTHYPSDYVSSPENRWGSLSPYLPDLSKIDPLSASIAQFTPDKAKYDREQRLRDIASPRTTPDETTSYTYSSDNNMTHADLPDGSDLDFKYDAAGRRLEKKYTKVINNVTHETKYTYHYIGSQITTIDIDGKEDTTVVKNDEIRIHLGANSRPISFEYYTDIGSEQQTSETYYYHYDLHGNVIRVTDSSGTTQITYTYDSLGTILTESNTNSIYNPFTWAGEAQIIHDPEFNTSASSPITGLYNSGTGYYNPETGTFLSGTGAPASTNPTSASAEEPTAQSTLPASQLGMHAALAGVAGGVPVSTAPATSTDVSPEPESDITPIAGTIALDVEWSYITDDATYDPEKDGPVEIWLSNQSTFPQKKKNFKGIGDRSWDAEWMAKFKEFLEGYSKCKDDDERKEYIRKNSHGLMLDSFSPLGAAVSKVDAWNSLPDEVRQKIIDEELNNHPEFVAELLLTNFLGGDTEALYWDWVTNNIIAKLEYAIYGTVNGVNYLLSYKLSENAPSFFWGPYTNGDAQHVTDGIVPGAKLDPTEETLAAGENGNKDVPKDWCFLSSWSSVQLKGINTTGENITVRLGMKSSTSPIDKTTISCVYIQIDANGNVTTGSTNLSIGLGVCYVNTGSKFEKYHIGKHR